MSRPPTAKPCPAFPLPVQFPDVEPEELAREEALMARSAGRWPQGAWDDYLQRVLPLLEGESPGDMALALASFGGGPVGARGHARTMRRRAVADGSVTRVRFWAEVLDALDRLNGD